MRMQHTEQAILRTTSRSHQALLLRRLVVGVGCLMVAVSLLQLVVANSFAGKGEDLARVLAKKEALKEENDILQTHIATLTSLEYIAQKARSMGLSDAKAVVFIRHDDDHKPIALEKQIKVQ